MKILAIDPGTTKSGFVVFWHGQVVASGDVPNFDLRNNLQRNLWGHEVTVCEMITSYGMPVGQETFETVRWIGRFEEVSNLNGIQFHTVFRKDVKMHLCGQPRAKDANIRMALIDKLGAPGTKKLPGPTYGISGDIWQALAVAVTFEETKKLCNTSTLATS